LQISLLQFDSHTRTRKIRPQFAINRLQYPVEKHVFDTNVIVEVFEIAQRLSGTSDVSVNGGSGVR
jgi:hypothetical protein